MKIIQGIPFERKGLKWRKEQLDDVPKRPGVYLLLWGSTIQYIGKSRDLQRRLKEHERADCYRDDEYIPFGSCTWYQTTMGFENELERVLIEKHQPPYNDRLVN
ncbi:MAG: GIY-YIG nuclease family protein [Candidatus Odinarchaeota archaeon]